MAVAGLEDELRKAGLERCLAAAVEWCERMGPKDMEEIGEEEIFDDFAEALQLRPLERRRLLKGPMGASRAAGGGYAGEGINVSTAAAEPSAPSKNVQVVGKGTWVVRNTFLDFDDGARASDLQRASTVPAPPKEVEEDDEPCEPFEEADFLPTIDSSLYKTMTFDSFEEDRNWDWLQGRHLEAVEEQHEELQEQEYPAEQEAVGMMIPIEAMPGYVVPVQDMCYPAGCFAVPMDRFGRFPGAMEQLPMPDISSIGVTTTADNKRAQVLQRAFSVASNVYRIRWTVDARKLKSTDKEAVSPQFDLTFSGGVVPFKMIMRPRAVAQERGGASFKRSRGRGNIQLRCMAESDDGTKPVVTFRLGVGSDKAAKQLKPRGPVRHDFSEKNICGLPAGQDDWDFGKAVDDKTQTFVVCLEILSGSE